MGIPSLPHTQPIGYWYFVIGSHLLEYFKSDVNLFGSFKPGPEVIKHFSCSTQPSLKFILLINVKMATIVGILTFMSRINDWP